jgi:hypothetical protein
MDISLAIREAPSKACDHSKLILKNTKYELTVVPR